MAVLPTRAWARLRSMLKRGGSDGRVLSIRECLGCSSELLDSPKVNLEFSPDLSQIGNAAVGEILGHRDCGTGPGRLPLLSATSGPSSLVDRSAAHRAARLRRVRACDAASRRVQQRASPCSSERSGNAMPGSCGNVRSGCARDGFQRPDYRASRSSFARHALLPDFVRLCLPASLSARDIARERGYCNA